MSATGIKWRTSALAQLLKSPGFAGLQSIRQRHADGSWPALAEVYLDPDTHRPVPVREGVITPTERAMILAQLAMRTDKRFAGRSRGRTPHVSAVGPLVRCAACGSRSALSGSRSSSSYRCSAMAGGVSCPAPFTAPKGGLDEYVGARFLAYVAELGPKDEQLRRIAERWTAYINPASVEDRTAAQAAMDAVDADLARARRLAVSGVLTEDEAAEEMGRLRTMRAQAVEVMAALPAAVLDVSPLLDLVVSREAWEVLPETERRDILALAIAEISVTRASGRGVRFDPASRVTIEWLD